MFNANFPDRVAPTGREPNFAGDRYGRLVLLGEVAGQGPRSRRKWLCRCDCGVETQVVQEGLRSGNSTSCGCFQREWASDNGRARATHGLTKHPLYKTYNGMLTRCYDPENSRFADWGGRGITVCERWHSVENFIADMAPSHRPWLTLERVDNSKGYSPANCVWASYVQQNRNRRDNLLVSYIGKNICLAEAAEIAGLPYHRVHLRIYRRNWSIPRALESENFQAPLLESAQTPEPLCLNP
jgi:hypothetical protein